MSTSNVASLLAAYSANGLTPGTNEIETLINSFVPYSDASGGGTNVAILNPSSYFASQTTLGIGATGTSQGTAQSLNTQINIIQTCGAGANSVILPIPPIGSEITVINQGAAGLSVYPPVNHGIDQLGINANVLVYITGCYKVVLANSNHWFTTANSIFAATE